VLVEVRFGCSTQRGRVVVHASEEAAIEVNGAEVVRVGVSECVGRLQELAEEGEFLVVCWDSSSGCNLSVYRVASGGERAKQRDGCVSGIPDKSLDESVRWCGLLARGELVGVGASLAAVVEVYDAEVVCVGAPKCVGGP
jgi:hypothetical protein